MLLRRIHRVPDFPVGAFVTQAGDDGAALNELPLHRLVRYDLRVEFHVGRRGCHFPQQRDVTDITYLLQFVHLSQFFDDGDQIHRLAAAVQIQHGPVDDLMGLPVKVVRLQDSGHGAHRFIVDEHGAEHVLLRGNILRNDFLLHRLLSPVVI